MRDPGLIPIASAVTLTVAAGLSIAAEHACSSHAAALGTALTVPVPQGTGGADIGSSDAHGRAAASHARDGTSAAQSPAVGSRAPTGHDEECPAVGKHP